MTLDHLLAPDARLEKVASGFTWVEGPAWIPARSVLRFSDIPGNRVVEFHEADGTTAVISDDAEFTNGRALARDGSVIECSHGRRAVQIDRAASAPGADYAPEILVDRFGSARLNSPNDVVEKSDGTIWFTDPSYGIKKPAEGHAGEEEYGDRYVFRLDPADGSLTPVVIDVEAPNGLAFSPDERTLYVSEAGTVARANTSSEIRAFDVADGRLSNDRVFAHVTNGVPDGIKVDTDGRVYAGTGDGVRIWAADGRPLGHIPTEGPCANVAFGGPDGRQLFLCAGKRVLAVETKVRGAAVRA